MEQNILWDIIREQIEERAKELRAVNDLSKLKQTFKVGSHMVFIQWKNNKEIFPSAVAILKDSHNENIIIKQGNDQIEIIEVKPLERDESE